MRTNFSSQSLASNIFFLFRYLGLDKSWHKVLFKFFRFERVWVVSWNATQEYFYSKKVISSYNINSFPFFSFLSFYQDVIENTNTNFESYIAWILLHFTEKLNIRIFSYWKLKGIKEYTETGNIRSSNRQLSLHLRSRRPRLVHKEVRAAKKVDRYNFTCSNRHRSNASFLLAREERQG